MAWIVGTGTEPIAHFHAQTPEPLSFAPMPRLSRRVVTALLWIAIALLPVRGWAAAVMPMPLDDITSALAGTTVDDAATAMPCHGAAADHDGASDNGSHACSLCDLCHGTVAQVAAPSVTVASTHESLPVAAPPRAIEPRSPDRLFRPPRTSLA